MSDNIQGRALAILIEAIEKPDAERLAFVRSACGADDALFREVQSLLDAHARAGEFMGSPTAARPTQAASIVSHEVPGSHIGRYKLLQQIGEGGFGVVYMAEQETPVKRRVALKVIKAGMDTNGVIARFEAERQALAMMDHPNIARVLDAGATDTGRPYFVMELVKGIPITEYCDQAKLDTEQRLNLFMDVCSAVQHAHQKGVIHRDLKPSNVMVTLRDDKPTVKVIDFGIAKATEQKLTEKTLFTAYGQLIGTPAYMSPEQAVLSELDVDTRSDIYSLGVLLYELLIGSPPFDVQTLRKAGFDEMRRIIREQQPQKPSTKLSTLAEGMRLTVAEQRHATPQTLSRQLYGDLDWIVLKAIEKDRARRYESASAFAEDIQRHLNSEPVIAAAPSSSYRLRKFVQRNKAPIATAAIIAFLLLGGTTLSTWQAVRATRAEGVARLAKEDADAKRVQAERQQSRAEAGEKLASERLVEVGAEKKKAEEEKQIAQAVRDFLQNKLLGQANARAQADALLQVGGPAAEAKENPTIRELLDRAARELSPERIDASFPQPLVQADILQTVGNTYHAVGEYERAVVFLQRSAALYRQHLGPDQLNTLVSMNDLASAYQAAGKMDLALPLFEETLKLTRARFGADHLETFTSLSNLAEAYQVAGKRDLALPLLEETLKRRKAKFGADDLGTLRSMIRLASAYKAAGKLDLAISLDEQTLKLRKAKLGPDHPDTLAAMHNLATDYRAAGKRDLALPLFEETLKLDTTKLGPDHPDTLTCMENLAAVYQDAGRLDLALPMFEETLKLWKVKLGPDHPETLRNMNNLAKAYWDAGKRDLALPMFEETLKLRKVKLGPDHPDTLNSINNLAMAYQETGKLDLALPLLEETLKLRRTKLGPGHPDTLTSMSNLACAYRVAGRPDLAAPLFEEVLTDQKARLGPNHSDTLTTMNCLATTYWLAKRFDKSIPLFEETLKRQEATLGRQDPNTLLSVADLGVSYKDAGRLEEALPLLEEGYRAARKYPNLRWVGPQLLDGYVRAGKTDQAVGLAKDMLAEARSTLPKNSPQLAGELGTLGHSLLQAKAFAEAEVFLRECLIILEKVQPEGWRKFNAQSMLGGALLGLKKYDEAEPLLLQGYEGMNEREATMPAPAKVYLTEALERLISFHETRGGDGHADQAAKYHKLLEQRRAAEKQNKENRSDNSLPLGDFRGDERVPDR